MLDVASSLITPVEPNKVQWEQADSGQISVSGEIEFSSGNVGCDAGTLVFTGSFESANSIKGKVSFFRADQNPKDPGTVPAKADDFMAKRVVTSSVTSVSAAGYSGSALAGESIVTAFGSNLAMATQAGATLSLSTSLAGTSVLVQTSGGAERFAPLFFVSPTQVNFRVPPGMCTEAATIAITSGDGVTSLDAKLIVAVAPGLFSANASGRGLASAIALRVKADGGQSYEPVARFDPAQNKFVSVQIDLSPAADQVFLLLFGTGLRGCSAVSTVTASIGGNQSEVLFAGPQVGLAGLD